MCAGADARLREELSTIVALLGRGDFREAAERGDALPAGSRGLVELAVVLGVIAEAMRLLALGDVASAWEQLAVAARGLPVGLHRRDASDGRSEARLVTPNPTVSADGLLAVHVAVLAWREQFRITDLRDRLAVPTARPRDVLIEAAVEQLCRVDFEPSAWRAPFAADDVCTAVDWSRQSMLRRATRLRQFVEPGAPEVSQSVWHDLRQRSNLRAEALRRLAQRPQTPWTSVAGAQRVPVCEGMALAWGFAQRPGMERRNHSA